VAPLLGTSVAKLDTHARLADLGLNAALTLRLHQSLTDEFTLLIPTDETLSALSVRALARLILHDFGFDIAPGEALSDPVRPNDALLSPACRCSAALYPGWFADTPGEIPPPADDITRQTPVRPPAVECFLARVRCRHMPGGSSSHECL
jgi:hypothetical protein